MWALSLLCLAVLCRPLHCVLRADDHVVRAGRTELQRLQDFAAQPRYGECWSRALKKIHTSCQEFTEETQSKIALAFTHCHLRRSGRSFPACTDSSEVRECTRDMDAIAFNTYTEFFTHAHSICQYLQSERWQHRAENTIHRLTESSAGVAEQLASTQRLAEDLVEAQSAALQTQEAILHNGEELRLALQDSTQGVKQVFAEIQDSAREQQIAFSEIFNRVAFLQSFIMSESHTLSSLLYNTLGLCAAFLLTSTQRTAGARLVLFGLVGVNVYLERLICKAVMESTNPGYLQMERIDLLVGLLRRAMVLVGVLVLAYFAVRFRDVSLESLEILAQLKETHSSLQQALRRAECLAETAETAETAEAAEAVEGRGAKATRAEGRRKEEEGAADMMVQELSAIMAPSFTSHSLSVSEEPSLSDSQQTDLCDSTTGDTQSALEVPRRRGRPRSSIHRHRPPAALVYSVLVEDTQPRYNLRNRRSLSGPVMGTETP